MLSTCRWGSVAVAVAMVSSVAPSGGCTPETSYPLIEAPPPDAGLNQGIGEGTSSSSGTSENDGGGACTETKVCSPVVDGGADPSCPPSGTMTGTITSASGHCAVELLSLGGPPTAEGCCSTACVPEGCSF